MALKILHLSVGWGVGMEANGERVGGWASGRARDGYAVGGRAGGRASGRVRDGWAVGGGRMGGWMGGWVAPSGKMC